MVGLGPVKCPSRNCLLSTRFILLLGILLWELSLSLYIRNTRVGIVGCRSQSMVGLSPVKSPSRNWLSTGFILLLVKTVVGIVAVPILLEILE